MLIFVLNYFYGYLKYDINFQVKVFKMQILITMDSPECLSLFFQFETVYGNISDYIGVEVLDVR